MGQLYPSLEATKCEAQATAIEWIGGCSPIGALGCAAGSVGEQLARSRRKTLDDLQPHWHQTVVGLADLDLELIYFQGWARDVTLLERWNIPANGTWPAAALTRDPIGRHMAEASR